MEDSGEVKIENEILLIACEKIESLKQQIKEQAKIKKELLAKIEEEEVPLKKNKELKRKLEREEKKMSIEIEQIEKECLKYEEILINIHDSFNSLKKEGEVSRERLEERIKECKGHIKIQKLKLLQEQDTHNQIEVNLRQKKTILKTKILNINALINNLQQQIKLNQAKQNTREKEFEANFKTLI